MTEPGMEAVLVSLEQEHGWERGAARFASDPSTRQALVDYRIAVIKSTECSFCHAGKDELCTYYNDPTDPTTRMVELPYVHDDRSMAYHLAQLSELKPTAVCTRTEDHLRHSLAVSLQCPGIGEQVCRPDDYRHLGPWHHVRGSDSLEKCEACGTVIGK